MLVSSVMQIIKTVGLLKVGQQALTLGLLRGLEDKPVEAPLTERDLTKRPEVIRLSKTHYHNEETV